MSADDSEKPRTAAVMDDGEDRPGGRKRLLDEMAFVEDDEGEPQAVGIDGAAVAGESPRNVRSDRSIAGAAQDEQRYAPQQITSSLSNNSIPALIHGMRQQHCTVAATAHARAILAGLEQPDTHADTVRVLQQYDFCSALVEAMTVHCDSLPMQQLLCSMIVKYSFRSPRNKSSLLEAGAALALSNVMNRFHDWNVQAFGCAAIANLLCQEQQQHHHHPGGYDDHRGGYQHLHYRMCGTTSCLGYYEQAYQDNKQQIVNQGGLAAIVQAMELFPDTTKVQRAACHALKNLTEGGDFLDLACDVGADVSLAKARTRFRGIDKDIVETSRVVTKRLLRL